MTCLTCNALKKDLENAIRFHSESSSPKASSLWTEISKAISEDKANEAWHNASSIALQGLYKKVYGQKAFMEFVRAGRKDLL